MGDFDFKRTSDYVVCIDSDGCAINTMEVKHRKCFGPQWIATYDLSTHFDACMEIWLSINLYSITRGINRFKGLALALKEVERRGWCHTEGLEEFVTWTEEAKELSNPALLALTQKNENECMEKALLWSIRTNRAIYGLQTNDMPFPNVKWAMDEMCEKADLVAVSSANKEAVEKEWEKHNLKSDCKMLLTQEAGSKVSCIGALIKMGYEPKKILMVGDAPSDFDAAERNGVWFYPILVGKEAKSWAELLDKAFEKLLDETFDETYQKELIRMFEKNLGV